MAIVLPILSRLCLGWTLVYLIFSLLSALRVGRRHYQWAIFLEFQPRRARGPWEVARARLIMRMMLCTFFVVPVGIASFIACVFMC
ncbi:putative membrane protein [Paraburkholderia xenovorans LB400]|nr:putative membrane protein [Paraburkholderia xenovorans LB400]